MTLQKAPLNIGDHLPIFSRTITQEKIDRFEAVGRMLVSEADELDTPAVRTGTTNDVAAGLPPTAASSQLSFAYLHELLARQFGADFRQGGQLSVTFLKPVYPGDTLNAHGMVTGTEQIEHRTRFTLQVWLENQHGEETSEGDAQVIVPSPLT